ESRGRAMRSYNPAPRSCFATAGSACTGSSSTPALWRVAAGVRFSSIRRARDARPVLGPLSPPARPSRAGARVGTFPEATPSSPAPAMTRFRVSIRAVLGGALLAAAAMPAPGSAQELVAWTGATVWDGTGAPARAGVTILARGARIEAIGPAVGIPAGARVVALDGRWVIPGLVNAHGHVSGDWASDPSASEEDRLRADLLLYARHG